MSTNALKRGAQIFLAHASEDEEAVRRLHAQLTDLGFRAWMAEIDLIAGQNWEEEIPRVINESAVFVAVLSQHSVAKTGYVQKEFRFALDVLTKKPAGAIYLIPVKLDDSEIPALEHPLGVRLRSLHWIDFWKPEGLKRLVAAINMVVSGDAPEPIRTTSSAPAASLKIVTSYEFAGMILKDGTSFRIVNLYLKNERSDKTFDDILIDLRLPAGIAFIREAPLAKPKFGQVIFPLSRPVNPGPDFTIGYVKKHCDPENLTAGMFGASSSKGAIDWTITARDVPASSGTVDVSQLLHSEPSAE